MFPVISRHDPVPASIDYFFFNDTATTEIYTLSLHDALPISREKVAEMPEHQSAPVRQPGSRPGPSLALSRIAARLEEHTSELQSRQYLVWRLLLVKKNLRVGLTFDGRPA